MTTIPETPPTPTTMTATAAKKLGALEAAQRDLEKAKARRAIAEAELEKEVVKQETAEMRRRLAEMRHQRAPPAGDDHCCRRDE